MLRPHQRASLSMLVVLASAGCLHTGYDPTPDDDSAGTTLLSGSGAEAGAPPDLASGGSAGADGGTGPGTGDSGSGGTGGSASSASGGSSGSGGFGSAGGSGGSGGTASVGGNGGSGGGDLPLGSPCPSAGSAITLSAPQHLASLSTDLWDAEPSLSADGLWLWTATFNGSNAIDVFRYSRSALGEPWENPQPESFNSRSSELRLSPTADLLGGVLNVHASSADLYWVERGDASSDWSSPVPIDELNTSNNEWDPWLSPDGLHLYFMTDNAGAGAPGGKDLLFSERATLADTWGTPALVDELNTPANEGNPTLTGDELVVVFSRSNSSGDDDLFWAVRARPDDPFEPPSQIPVVNTTAQDTEPMISADGCELYFASDRAGGKGNLDLYVSRVVAQ